MQKIAELIKKEAQELLASQAVQAVAAWRGGEEAYAVSPALFTDAEELQQLVYNDFCGANLSKLVYRQRRLGKIAVFLKPCDTYSLNQLIKDNVLERDSIVAIGIPCAGMLDLRKVRALGIWGIKEITGEGEELLFTTVYGERRVRREGLLLEKCLACKGSEYMLADKTLGEPLQAEHAPYDRFARMEKLAALPEAERFAFWQQTLSRCIRCNACREACPVCLCEQCVFDNQYSGVAAKANVNSAEEQLFHLIRAYHVAGRCTDCGECSRVCPQSIPLELINRKFIKDINDIYGTYQAGDNSGRKPPLLDYRAEDAEADVLDKGGKR